MAAVEGKRVSDDDVTFLQGGGKRRIGFVGPRRLQSLEAIALRKHYVERDARLRPFHGAA